MVQTVIYAVERSFRGRLAIQTIREHLCGFYQQGVNCVESGTEVDGDTGHTVCCGCNRITVQSGLRECDICGKEYIDLTKYQNPRYETNCPRCVVEYEL